MYRLSTGNVAEEATSATQLVGDVAERLRRLARAYGEWRIFEAGPYFDLTPTQVTLLTRVVERAETVHVVFFVDALLPAFQAVHRYAAAQAAMTPTTSEHIETIYTTLVAHWQRMLEVFEEVRSRLRHDISFLAFSGAAEEQTRWAHVRPSANANASAPWALTPASVLPTLTLSVDFPLPAFRQPGRKRRLRRTWQRLFRRPTGRTIR